MTVYLFPDNTVLCNFAAVDRLPLSRQVLDSRGRWVEAIAFEAARSSRVHHCLADISRDGWLGDPIEIAAVDDVRQVELVRRHVFGGLASGPTKHLGEAQTCHIIKNWRDYKDSFWITDDREALRYARFQGITARETCDLVSEALASGYVTRPEGMALLRGMVARGRHL